MDNKKRLDKLADERYKLVHDHQALTQIAANDLRIDVQYIRLLSSSYLRDRLLKAIEERIEEIDSELEHYFKYK